MKDYSVTLTLNFDIRAVDRQRANERAQSILDKIRVESGTVRLWAKGTEVKVDSLESTVEEAYHDH